MIIFKYSLGKTLLTKLKYLVFPISDIIPKEQVVDIGRQARMECIVETPGGDDDSSRHVITWMKDGQPLPNRTRIILSGRALQIFVLQREDYGKNTLLCVIYFLVFNNNAE